MANTPCWPPLPIVLCGHTTKRSDSLYFMANLKFKYPLALQKLAFEDDVDK